MISKYNCNFILKYTTIILEKLLIIPTYNEKENVASITENRILIYSKIFMFLL